MKKYKSLIYVLLIIIIVLIGFFIYKVLGKNENNYNNKEKTVSEIKDIEYRFVNIFNLLNDISFDNYKISLTKIEENNNNNTESQDSNSSSSSSSDSNKNESGNESKASTSSQINEKYTMEESGILTNDVSIDWEEIKSEVEIMYSKIYSLALDLYQTSAKQEDIIKFNKEYDSLAIAVKEENKGKTLEELAKLYNYLPEFIQDCSDDEKQIIIIKTKNYIFQAYSKLDAEDWESISDNVDSAIQEFTKLVTDITNIEKENQYTINKIYIILNELLNSIQLQDREVFLIKYKNVLEELQNL